MINLTELKIFNPKDIPDNIVSYKIEIDNKFKSEAISYIPNDGNSIWTANEKFINIVWRLIATCQINNRISLAAPHVGIHKNFFVMKLFDLIGEGAKPSEKTMNNSSFIVLINPSWSHNIRNEAKVSAYETCSSSPDEKILVERPYSIIAQYTTLNITNANYNIIEELNGWRSRTFLREWEHLQGIKLIDYKK